VIPHTWSINKVLNWHGLGALGALGSLMAGITAVVVLVWNFWRVRKADLRDQASRITWWLEKDNDTREGVREFADAAVDDSGFKYVRIFIRNGSEDCIYECSLKLPKFLNYDEMPRLPEDWRQIGVLPPGPSQFRIQVTSQPTPTQELRTKADLFFNKHVEWVRFRDRNDTLWKRYGDGRLEKQPYQKPYTETEYSP